MSPEQITQAQLLEKLLTASITAVEPLVKAYAHLEVEAYKDTLTDDYGVRWRDKDDHAKWYSVWGFSGFKEANSYLRGVNLFSKDHGKIMHRLVTEHSEITKE